MDNEAGVYGTTLLVPRERYDIIPVGLSYSLIHARWGTAV